MTSASSTSEGALPFRSPISHNNRAFAFGLFGWLCCTSSVTSPNAATRLLSLFFHGIICRKMIGCPARGAGKPLGGARRRPWTWARRAYAEPARLAVYVACVVVLVLSVLMRGTSLWGWVLWR